MPSFEEIIGDDKTFTNDRKVLVGDVEVSLGDIRKGYLRDADYRRKTEDVANRRRQFEQERIEFENQRLTAEQQLAAMAQQITQRQPGVTKDEAEEILERDPVAKRLRSEIREATAAVREMQETVGQLRRDSKMQEQMFIADQHRRVLAALKQFDPALDEDGLINYARTRGIPRLDDAYKLYKFDDIVKGVQDKTREEATTTAYEKAKKDLTQPVVPATRVVKPAPDAPKDFEEAASAAINDPEILKELSQWSSVR